MHKHIISGPPIKTNHIKTVGELFFESCEKYGDKIYQIESETGKSETFKNVKKRSVRVCLELQNRGVKSEDVVAFCSLNTPDLPVPVLATLYLGAKIANLDPRLSAKQTAHLLSLIKPKIVFVEEPSVELIEKSLGNLKTDIVVYGQSDKYPTLADFLKVKDNEDEFRPKKVDVDDIIFIFFSSGTTGLPKPICHTHRTISTLMNQIDDFKINPKSFMSYSTFYWISGLSFFTYIFYKGGCRIINSTATAKSVLESIHKYKLTCMFLTPMLTYQFPSVENFESYNTSSLEVAFISGSAPNPLLLEKATAILKHTKFFISYAMTEAGICTTFTGNVDPDFLKKKFNSCGPVAPGVSIKVVDLDDESNILGPNEKGEVRVKTKTFMKGYYKMSSEGAWDADGFMRTGDVGYYDEDGCVYITGRIKEMFKYYNWQIYPTAIESVLIEHPAVKEAVVYGIPVAEGEMPAALVVLKNGFQGDEKIIRQFVDEKVSDKERLIGGVRFVEKLPRTPTGKLVRREIASLVL